MNNFNSDDWYDASFQPDEMIERKLSRMHPSPEEALLKMAIEKALNKRQREVWELYAYDRLTFEELGKKLKINRSSALRRIQTIEKKLKKYCLEHKKVYDAINEAVG